MAQAWAKDFYESKAWIKCRKSFYKSKFGICERCGRAGKIVHHKIWLTPENIGDPNITLNWDNLELLCQDCHTKEHLSKGNTSSEVMFDDEGNLNKR